MRDWVIKNFDDAFAKQSKYYNLRRRKLRFHKGNLVLSRSRIPSSKIKNISAKLCPRYLGPYRISKVLSPTVYKLCDLTHKFVGKAHIEDLKPYVPPLPMLTLPILRLTMADQHHPPGWEYLEEYSSFIAQTERDRPGFFTAFQEALQAQKEACEVRQTAVLTEVPTDEEIMERLRRKYDLVPRHTIHQKDEATSTVGLSRSSGTGVQTEETTGCSCHCHLVTPLRPKTQFRPNPPTSPGPSSNDPHFRPPTPVRPSSSRHTSTDPYPKRSPTPSPPKQMPSLLNLKIPSPNRVNPQTMEFLRATGEFGCWNCSEGTHRYLQCPHPRQVFCFGCGRKGVLRSPVPCAATTPLSSFFFHPFCSLFLFF